MALGKLKRGAVSSTAALFGLHRDTVSKSWSNCSMPSAKLGRVDLNVLDLGFFASIQSLQQKAISRTVDDIIRATLAAFGDLDSMKLEKVFLTFQAVMRKDVLRRAETPVVNVYCPTSLLL
ncbi:hypothetical protein H310_15002 [Aphanomyces invadans]|uniref:Uncharacterized protein n=1 Tax=Aphanomyces invadans TaxID=157072 RepID=A0A024T858_9STRA|nr:hypothetical protein H310_15002 [Aphanomyces invadans]ETV90163.1 hypothetical protein H310_15002 [Aphanomyces invadans]|eukprot:XP_008881204.1 hypothetical protein H310_15002 [Aphanomyces invadans]